MPEARRCPSWPVRLRPRARRDPCDGGRRGSSGRPACASADGSRASWPGGGCSAGRCACSRVSPMGSGGRRRCVARSPAYWAGGERVDRRRPRSASPWKPTEPPNRVCRWDRTISPTGPDEAASAMGMREGSQTAELHDTGAREGGSNPRGATAPHAARTPCSFGEAKQSDTPSSRRLSAPARLSGCRSLVTFSLRPPIHPPVHRVWTKCGQGCMGAFADCVTLWA